MDTNERYLNLAMINMGEALTTFGNMRQSGVPPGTGYTAVTLALLRAISALNGKLWEAPPVDPQHVGIDTKVRVTGALSGSE
jgi:hypothetical protein